MDEEQAHLPWKASKQAQNYPLDWPDTGQMDNEVEGWK